MEAEYPTDEELQKIKEWKIDDMAGLLAFIKPLWRYADCGYWEEKKSLYHLHTAGWSGNEDIIGAMRDNHIWWLMFWCRSERGGHYVFGTSRDWLDVEYDFRF